MTLPVQGARWRAAALAVTVLLAAWGAMAQASDAGAPAATAESDAGARADAEAAPTWCAPELEALDEGTCHFAPAGDAPATLVVFLHGVIQPGTTWQWAQQRAIARAAHVNGFSALMPRGRRGIGPKTMTDWWTWPTGARAQTLVEQHVLAEWDAARSALEARRGKPFERVLVFGFSNGAYYATSLAFRSRWPADGWGIFAGGSAPGWLTRHLRSAKGLPPMYVGWGTKDRARKDPAGLVEALARLGWRHRSGERRGVGHTMTDSQLRDAVRFLAPVVKPSVR